MTANIQGLFAVAFLHIKALLATGKYDTVICSADAHDPDMIGISTFAVGDDVRRVFVAGVRGGRSWRACVAGLRALVPPVVVPPVVVPPVVPGET